MIRRKRGNTKKACDREKWVDAYNKYFNGEINQNEFANEIGVTCKVLSTRLEELYATGMLRGVFFTDGQPIYLDIPFEFPKEAAAGTKRRGNGNT